MMEHRGRFQAQGSGLEESEAWAQDEALPALLAHHLLSGLASKVPAKESVLRLDSFMKAHRFIDSACSAGGVGPCKKSYLVRGSRDQRVDIEVQSGLAFV